MRKPELQRLFDLQSFLLKFHYIERVTHHPTNKARYESDTEHAFSLAMAAWFLAQSFPELDQNKIIRLALVHDLVEIYAGDTFVYADPSVLATKPHREQTALKRIEEEWPDFPEMTRAIHDYEDRQTPESNFVYALDKLMPILMIFLGEGHTWKKKNITLDQLIANKTNKVAASPEINEYYKKLVKLLQENKQFFAQKKT